VGLTAVAFPSSRIAAGGPVFGPTQTTGEIRRADRRAMRLQRKIK
jgi:hypothetical protein